MWQKMKKLTFYKMLKDRNVPAYNVQLKRKKSFKPNNMLKAFKLMCYLSLIGYKIMNFQKHFPVWQNDK